MPIIETFLDTFTVLLTSVNILHAVLYTSPKALTKRI